MLGIAILVGLTFGTAWMRAALNDETPSRAEGRPGQGRIRFARSMPPAGDGYETYSHLGAALGRQYVHSALFATLRTAFKRAANEEPGRCFQLAETGWRHGGRFRPHRTHQNGLSVDILMPVSDSQGRATQLATWPWQLFGYGWEFDAKGNADSLHIDFNVLARLLLSLDEAAAQNGLRIELVIVTPEYQPLLFATPLGAKLQPLRARFMRRQAWVRHDEHIHIDFAPASEK